MKPTVLKISFLISLVVLVAAAALAHGHERVPTDAPKAEFCDFWTNFPQHPDGVDPLSEEALAQNAEDFRTLGVPSDASDQVRESLEMRVEFAQAWARGELTDDSDPTQGDLETWSALEDYVAKEC